MVWRSLGEDFMKNTARLIVLLEVLKIIIFDNSFSTLVRPIVGYNKRKSKLKTKGYSKGTSTAPCTVSLFFFVFPVNFEHIQANFQCINLPSKHLPVQSQPYKH